MKKFIISLMLFSFISGQSMNANLTLYKNGYTLVKQPVYWNIPEGDSQITYSLIPNQLYPETPFLSLMSNTEIISQRLNNKLFFSWSSFWLLCWRSFFCWCLFCFWLLCSSFSSFLFFFSCR